MNENNNFQREEFWKSGATVSEPSPVEGVGSRVGNILADPRKLSSPRGHA